MPTLDTLQTRYKEVMERVAAAATRAGRRASDVLVVAVTKYADMEQLRELVSLGHRDLAESKVQQLLQRAGVVEEMLERRRTMRGVTASHDAGLEGSRATEPSLFSPIAPRPRTQPGAGPAEPAPANGGVRWHMIGHLQRNKVKKAVEVSRLIHSVDSLRLVEEIQQFAFKRDRISEVLVQVNCSGEESKFGCAVPAAMHLCEQVDSMIHLRIRGPLTVARGGSSAYNSKLGYKPSNSETPDA